MQSFNTSLIIAGTLSFIASILHLSIIIGGPQWYRFFGAGEKMAQMAERGLLYPALITAGIALVLFIWGLYAYSAAGLIVKLPLMKPALGIITAIYLLRGVVGFILAFHPGMKESQDFSFSFWIISSAICLVYGLVHLIGVYGNWANLSSLD